MAEHSLLGLPGNSCAKGEHLFTVAVDGYVCVRCADAVDQQPEGETFDPHWSRTSGGWNVSYRQQLWQRRYYACGNVSRDEAEQCAQFMKLNGYRRVRLESSGV